jgi:hypothetical protein
MDMVSDARDVCGVFACGHLQRAAGATPDQAVSDIGVFWEIYERIRQTVVDSAQPVNK